MRRSEMKLLLEERFERISLLETRIDTMDQLVEGYRAREQAVLDTLQLAKKNAAILIEQANADAQQIRDTAKREAETLIAQASASSQKITSEAEALLAEATAASKKISSETERQAVEIIAGAKADSDRMLRDAEIIKREFEEMVDSFNALLEQNAIELQVTAARFAEFVKNRKIDPTEIHVSGDTFYKSVGAINDSSLPDASEDPSQLMQNIYRIQNRPLPEDALDQAVSESDEPKGEELTKLDAQSESPAVADEPLIPVEPYSEAAWVNEAQESKSEPQAEFTKSFNDEFFASEFVVRADGCNLSRGDAEQAFDALFTAPEFAAASTAAAVVPDAAAHAAIESSETQMEAENAFDEFLRANEAAATAAEPEKAEPVAEPEPYSEAAYVNDAFTSEFEPQAEFTPAFGAEALKSEPVQGDMPVSTDGEQAFDALFASLSETTPATEPAATEPAATVEPYSEAAFVNDAFTSEFEPQAEFTPAFGAEVPKSEPAQSEAPLGTDGEQAFDALFASLNETAPATEPVATAPAAAVEPYSEAAYVNDAFTSEFEPQAEFTPAFGAEAHKSEPAQTQSASSVDAGQAFDELFAFSGAFAPTAEPVAEQSAATVEPYSEAAYANPAFTSEYEPQAEGALLSEMPEAAEEPEPTPAPRRYNEYGEIREWEPEPEPDMSDIPTVSRYVGQSNEEKEVSLDELLDEIIKAGE